MSFGSAMKATPKRKRPNEMSAARIRMRVVYQTEPGRSPVMPSNPDVMLRREATRTMRATSLADALSSAIDSAVSILGAALE